MLTLALSLVALITVAAHGQTTYQWVQARSGSWPIYAVAAAPTTPAIVLVEDGFTIYRTTNAGSVWSTVSPSASFPGNAFAFDPASPSIVYSGRSHGMLKSTDGGASWFGLPDLNAGPGAKCEGS